MNSLADSIADTLGRLDAFFENKKTTESYLIMLLPVFVIGYIALEIVIPATTKMYTDSKQQYEKTVNSIQNLQATMDRLTVNGDKMYRVKVLEGEIDNLKESIASLNDGSDYIDSQMVKISDILFNKESWSEFIDSITQKAHDNDVKITSIDNRFIEGDGEFGHVLEIGIDCKADFNQMLNFLATIEQSQLLVDVYGMQLQAGQTIGGAFKVSVWGFSQ